MTRVQATFAFVVSAKVAEKKDWRNFRGTDRLINGSWFVKIEMCGGRLRC